MKGFLQRILIGWFIKHVFVGVTFKKAPRNQNGEVILKRAKFIMFFLMTFLAISLFLLLDATFGQTYRGAERLQIIQLTCMLSAFFTIFSLILGVSKTVVDHHGITTHRINGTKHIDFNSITEIHYINQFGGCAVLKGSGTVLRVPVGTVGFSECHDLMIEKLGQEKCAPITEQLLSYKRMIATYS